MLTAGNRKNSDLKKKMLEPRNEDDYEYILFNYIQNLLLLSADNSI